MSDFNIDNAIPATKENGEDIRSAPFSLENAVPVHPLDPGIKQREEFSNVQTGAVNVLQGINKAAQVIRWPFARFIEHPVSTAITYPIAADVLCVGVRLDTEKDTRAMPTENW